MKYNPAVISFFFQKESTKRNVRQLLKFLLVLTAMVAVYSVLFHFIMAAEGKDHTWLTGVYWTLTVMSTLGFGDITFQTDLGRVFSIVVLLSGMIFLLTLLPFMFIKFFYAPWIEAESRKRAPRELPPETKDHVIITSYDPVTMALIEKLDELRHEVRETPGHSSGHVVYLWTGDTPWLVFGGDMLFQGSVGRADFPDSNPSQLIASIRQQLYTLPDDTIVMPGHGDPTTIGEEKR